MSSVLYDIPGPRARARNRLLTVVGALVVLGLLALAVWRLAVNDQLELYCTRAKGWPSWSMCTPAAPGWLMSGRTIMGQ